MIHTSHKLHHLYITCKGDSTLLLLCKPGADLFGHYIFRLERTVCRILACEIKINYTTNYTVLYRQLLLCCIWPSYNISLPSRPDGWHHCCIHTLCVCASATMNITNAFIQSPFQPPAKISHTNAHVCAHTHTKHQQRRMSWCHVEWQQWLWQSILTGRSYVIAKKTHMHTDTLVCTYCTYKYSSSIVTLYVHALQL